MKRNWCQAHLCGLPNPDMSQQNLGAVSYSRGSDGSCKPCLFLQGCYLLFTVKVTITHSDYMTMYHPLVMQVSNFIFAS